MQVYITPHNAQARSGAPKSLQSSFAYPFFIPDRLTLESTKLERNDHLLERPLITEPRPYLFARHFDLDLCYPIRTFNLGIRIKLPRSPHREIIIDSAP
jgi:hypothetical protein